jgi:hypothetical protein
VGRLLLSWEREKGQSVFFIGLIEGGQQLGLAPDSIFAKAADGTGVARAVIDGGMPAVSPDMKYLVFKRAIKGQQDDIYYMEMETKETVPLIATAADEDTPILSPAGGYLAYDSDESGGWELYVTPFPSGSGKWQVSLGDYAHANWGADGKTIQYALMGGIFWKCNSAWVPVAWSSPRRRCFLTRMS